MADVNGNALEALSEEFYDCPEDFTLRHATKFQKDDEGGNVVQAEESFYYDCTEEDDALRRTVEEAVKPLQDMLQNCDPLAAPELPDLSEALAGTSLEEEGPAYLDEGLLQDLESSMTEEEKETARSKALELKQKANGLFGQGKFMEAVEQYTEALTTLPPSYSEDRAVFFANRAASFIKMEDWPRAEKDADAALALQPDYTKALQRRALCRQRRDEGLEGAMEDWTRLKELEPGNRAAWEACAALGPRIAERNERLKTEMMGQLKGIGNALLRPFGLSTDQFELVQQEGGGYTVRTKNPSS